MAKVPFSKLQATINSAENNVFYLNKSGEQIFYNVKNYLPMKEKIDLITNVINNSIDDNGFYNPIKVKVYMTLEIVYHYTNLSFTEKMKEDPLKLYDALVSTGIFSEIAANINEDDLKTIEEDVWSTIKNIYDYKNSAMGILDIIVDDYKGLKLEASEIQNKLADPENMELLKGIISRLG